MQEKIRNFIGGEFLEPCRGAYLDNVEPATGKAYSEVADSEAEDVELAVAAAEQAFPKWSRTNVAERSRFIGSNAAGVEGPGRGCSYRQAHFTCALVRYSTRRR